MALKIIALICWGVSGILTLTDRERPTKLQYGLCWVILMLWLTLELFR